MGKFVNVLAPEYKAQVRAIKAIELNAESSLLSSMLEQAYALKARDKYKKFFEKPIADLLPNIEEYIRVGKEIEEFNREVMKDGI